MNELEHVYCVYVYLRAAIKRRKPSSFTTMASIMAYVAESFQKKTPEKIKLLLTMFKVNFKLTINCFTLIDGSYQKYDDTRDTRLSST